MLIRIMDLRIDTETHGSLLLLGYYWSTIAIFIPAASYGVQGKVESHFYIGIAAYVL